MIGKHASHKDLHSEFKDILNLLQSRGEQSFRTPRGVSFVASAARTKRGQDPDTPFIQVSSLNGVESARIYSCCWGHTTNCYGAHIGGYSAGLDKLT